MPKVLELKRARKELVEKLAPLAEKEPLDEAEQKAFAEMRAQLEGLARQIERAEFVEGERTALARLDPMPVKPRPEGDPPPPAAPSAKGKKPVIANPGFECVGELVYCARFRPEDPRVQALLEMGTGESGGLPIPDDIDPTIREVAPQDAIMRPRAVVVPAGDSPDADLVLPSLNQGSGASIYGGVQVDWVREGAEKPETSLKLRESRWSPKEVAAHIVVTDKLLRNWRSATTFIERMLRAGILAAEDVAFLRGNGVGRPLGALASPALKKVNRAAANDVGYGDLVNMEAELHEDGEAVWIVNPRVIPKLRQMEDTAGHLIWQEDARSGAPPTLLGRQVVRNYRSPALGSLGDVLLLVPSYYLIKDGVQTTVAASEHVLFKQNKTVVKAFKSVDGAPWLDGPIAQEDGQTYSPFVGLDVPA
ncbi:MAG: phage major capsid protein [Planctomycetaceae bacterium]|nr:phage major capsid protein [Planctomycetota bacterium]MCK6530872.1 phage major capsid protein [Myxococcota bacterium]NUN53384.1 phage major capsid protein [Planctomycetaceae bacterium]